MTDTTSIPGTAPTPIPFGDTAILPVDPPVEHVEAVPDPPVDTDVHISFDFSPVTDSHGSPNAWAAYLRQYLGHIAGVWLDQEDLIDVFAAYAGQVTANEARESFFTVSNITIPSKMTGDPSLIALQMRADIAAVLKKRANLQ